MRIIEVPAVLDIRAGALASLPATASAFDLGDVLVVSGAIFSRRHAEDIAAALRASGSRVELVVACEGTAAASHAVADRCRRRLRVASGDTWQKRSVISQATSSTMPHA